MTAPVPAPAKILVTLVWDTGSTDLDLYVTEPDGRSVWYSSKVAAGTLDVDRTQGYGPENYSIGRSAQAGPYVVRVHYFAARAIGRSEWTARVITDEGTPAQQRRTFYGVLTQSLGNQGPGQRGADWNDICTVRLVDGQATIAGSER